MIYAIEINSRKSGFRSWETDAKGKRLYLLLFISCLLLLFSLFLALPALSEEKGEIKRVAVIVGDEVMGKLKQPSGLFFDETKKRLYLSDSGNNRLISFDSEFKYLAELSDEAMTLPLSMVRNKEGQFFVLNGGKAEILFIDIEKKTTESFSITGIPEGKEHLIPGGIAIDKDSNLYIVDKLNKRLLVIEPSGAFVRAIAVKDSGFYGFTDVKVNDNGLIYTVDAIGGFVYVFDQKGDIISKFGGKGDKKGGLRFPVSLATDAAGLIYVTDQHAGRVFVFDSKGRVQYTISKPGVKEGELSNPSYISIDKEGRIYIIDNNRLQIFQQEKG